MSARVGEPGGNLNDRRRSGFHRRQDRTGASARNRKRADVLHDIIAAKRRDVRSGETRMDYTREKYWQAIDILVGAAPLQNRLTFAAEYLIRLLHFCDFALAFDFQPSLIAGLRVRADVGEESPNVFLDSLSMGVVGAQL
jgi:hypothetical protein